MGGDYGDSLSVAYKNCSDFELSSLSFILQHIMKSKVLEDTPIMAKHADIMIISGWCLGEIFSTVCGGMIESEEF